MPNTLIKRAVVGATVLGVASALAFLVVACGQTSAPLKRTSAAAAPRPEWHVLPTAPIRVDGFLTSVWTGRELIVSGVRAGQDGTFTEATEVAASYDPRARTWRRLAVPPRMDGPCKRSAAWTGTEMLVWGCLGKAAAYDPRTDTWRRLAPPPVPVAGTAVWDGHELLVVGDGRTALAYDPASDRWRRLAPLLAPRLAQAMVWTGTRALLWGAAGASAPDPAGLAYDPVDDRWSILPALPFADASMTAAWTGRSLLVWFGSGDGASLAPQSSGSTR